MLSHDFEETLKSAISNCNMSPIVQLTTRIKTRGLFTKGRIAYLLLIRIFLAIKLFVTGSK